MVYNVNCNGKMMYFNETPTAAALIKEIFNDNYKIFERNVKFEAGDVVLDVGANEGVFSIMIAKLFPFVRVISLEPVPRTFYQMIRNIGLNGTTNIEPLNVGVGKGVEGVMNVHKQFSGGSSLVDTYDSAQHDQIPVALMSLDDVYMKYDLKRIKLLKIDIEGGEYDAIYNSNILSQVDNVVGEFHINSRLTSRGYDINSLATYVGERSNLVYYEKCQMAE